MAFLERDTLFAGHVIGRLIAVGRVAEVYEGVAPDGHDRALKVIKPDVPLPSKSQARLGQEGEAIASIEHVNVVRFHDAGVEDGRMYLVLELVRGPNLRQLVQLEGGSLPVERAVSIVRQACEGVTAAHALGILHRDLKPENILVAEGDLAKVADFGSANIGALGLKTSLSEHDLSSSLYLAPECARQSPAEERSDVYAMGLVLYEAIAGVNPMAPGPTTAIAIVGRHMFYEPPALSTLGRDVPGDVSDLVRRAMAKAPAARPSMREFANGLAKALWRLNAPRRAVAARVPLPNRQGALAPTEQEMPAFGEGELGEGGFGFGARGTVRMEAWVEGAGAGGGGEGDRSAIPAPAPMAVSGGEAGRGRGSGEREKEVSSGAETWRSRVDATVTVITVAEGERGSTTVPVESAAARVSTGPRVGRVAVAIAGLGAVVLVELGMMGWMVFGGRGGGEARVSAAPGASAVVTAVPAVVASGAVPVPTVSASASASAGRAKAPVVGPQRRQAGPQRGKRPY